ncbi:BTAD domain-containing putative transcriptional regulator [Amycolatopsis sp. NPDC059021]|uniref:AfsR/SARP family transcriptional regulator n=1 Tax=Amycolatopsis sp. NPDC059021 TaxID=3346704 RepID=UPI0036715F91
MHFRLLGVVTAHVDGRLVRIGEPKRMLFLAVLLLADGRPVPKDTLIDRLWEHNPPATAQARLRNIATEVRARLETAEPGEGHLLPPGEGGYRMRVARERVDLWRFRESCSQAARLAERAPVKALHHIRAGLNEWTETSIHTAEPEPLHRLEGGWIAGVRVGLQQEYRRALTQCARLELRLGEPNQALTRLETLIKLDPCDEDVAELLMNAYCLVGRIPDALQVFRELRKELKELGDEPGPALTKLNQRVIDGDPALRWDMSDQPTATIEEPLTNLGSTSYDKAAETLARSAAQLVVATARDGSVERAGVPGGDLVRFLRNEFDGDDRATATLTRVLSSPGDLDAVRQLCETLVVSLRADQSFRQGVERLVDDGPALAKGGIFAEKVRNAAVYNGKVVINRGGFRIGG